MLKWLRRFLYLGMIVMSIYTWHVIHKASAEAAFNKFKKDLFIDKISPVNPPSFTLTDQYGKTIPLSAFKNKMVVIQPMDPECTDICPLISEELINANKQLGSLAKNVVYIGLNVNAYHNQVKDVKAFSDQHGLTTLKNWHFLTGSAYALKKIWAAYGITVVPNKNGDVMHTSAIIFVNRNGQEVYDGTPQNDKASVKEWTDAISFILKQMS